MDFFSHMIVACESWNHATQQTTNYTHTHTLHTEHSTKQSTIVGESGDIFLFDIPQRIRELRRRICLKIEFWTLNDWWEWFTFTSEMGLCTTVM